MRMGPSTFRTALAALALIATGPVMAATFNESGGDFGGVFPGLTSGPTLALEIGSNAISGQLDSQLDFDSFAVTVPTGAEILSLAFALTSNGSGIGGMRFVLSGPATSATQDFLAGTTDPAFAAVSLPLGAGTYAFSNQSLLLNAAFADPADWRWDITVAPVPLPATAPMLLAALGLAGVVARRRRRRS